MKIHTYKAGLFITCLLVALHLIVGASPVNANSRLPLGRLDGLNNAFILYGWAYDPDVPSQSIQVHIYVNGRLAVAITADRLRADVNQYYGITGNHGWEWRLPDNLRTGTHNFTVYAINNTPNSVNPPIGMGNFTMANQLPFGHVDGINTSFVLTGWVVDRNVETSPTKIHIYVDGPAGQGQFLAEVAANRPRPDVNTARNVVGDHGFAWTLPSGTRIGRRAFYVYAINTPQGTNPQLIGSPITIGDIPNPNATIGRNAGPSRIEIKTTGRVAGAINSLTWGGREFINSFDTPGFVPNTDHGRQLQSASSFNYLEECFNPTEAGSRADGSSLFSTSLLQFIRTTSSIVETRTQMAYYLSPLSTGGVWPDKCANTSGAMFKRALSNHILRKYVRIGFPVGATTLDHVIEYRTDFIIPYDESYSHGKFEAVTAYLPNLNDTGFNTFHLFNYTTRRLEPDEDLFENALGNDGYGKEQARPVVISTSDGRYAIGVYSPDLPEAGIGYGRFIYKQEGVTKWNCVFRKAPIIRGSTHSFRCYIVVGSLENVRVSIDQLDKYFYPNGNPRVTPTPSQSSAPPFGEPKR